MNLIQREELGSPIVAVNASKDGRLVAALTESNRLDVFSATPEGGFCRIGATDISKLHPGLACRECDLAFHPATDEIIVIGVQNTVVGKYAYSSLAILLLSRDGQVLRHHFLVEADPPYSSPVVTDTAAPVLLVGTGCGVLCIELESGQECGRLENLDEYVASRSIIPWHTDGTKVLVIWTYQAGSRISSYRRLDDNSFTAIQESDQLLQFHAWGAVLNNEDTKLAVTLGSIGAPIVEADTFADPLSLGQVHVYEPDTQRVLSTYDVPGQVGSDFVIQRVDSLRSGPAGPAWVPTSSLVPKRHLSNPVYLGDDRVAFGTPSGSVRVLDIHKGMQSEINSTDSAITSLAACVEGNVLCVGSANGSVFFFEIEI